MGAVGTITNAQMPQNIQDIAVRYSSSILATELLKSEKQQLADYVSENSSNQGVIYRGLDLSDSDFANLKVGETLSSADVVESWSKKQSSAREFATQNVNKSSIYGHNAVILKDTSGKGVDISNISKFKGEAEVLVPSNNYIVDDIKQTTTTTYGYGGKKVETPLTIITVRKS